MEKLLMSSRNFSDLVWRQIYESSTYKLLEKKDPFFKIMSALDNLRVSADYNTGSIPSASAWGLYATTCLFKPCNIIEIGTFIGRSSIAMALGMADSGIKEGEVHTCDFSNDIKLPSIENASIIQYPMQSSTMMLEKIVAANPDGKKFDMVHFDGRLQKSDYDLLNGLRSPDMIFALDDFEGMEKGVINYINMKKTKLLDSYQLVLPPSPLLLRDFDFHDSSSTALLVPNSSFLLPG